MCGELDVKTLKPKRKLDLDDVKIFVRRVYLRDTFLLVSDHMHDSESGLGIFLYYLNLMYNIMYHGAFK